MNDISTWSAVKVAAAFVLSVGVIAVAAGLSMILLAASDYFRDGNC